MRNEESEEEVALIREIDLPINVGDYFNLTGTVDRENNELMFTGFATVKYDPSVKKVRAAIHVLRRAGGHLLKITDETRTPATIQTFKVYHDAPTSMAKLLRLGWKQVKPEVAREYLDPTESKEPSPPAQ